MNYWYLLAAIPVFGLLVVVHELGHFIAARWAGIRVEEFGLGLPPTIVGFRKRLNKGGWEVMWFGRRREPIYDEGENPLQEQAEEANTEEENPNTIYSLNLLPIGGFVRMPGENGDPNDEYGHPDPGSFAAKPAGKRIVVLVAGVLMNFLMAMLLFMIAFTQGEYKVPTVLAEVKAGSPAAQAGIKAGDKVIAINGVKVDYFDDLVRQMYNVTADQRGKDHQAQTVPVTVQVERNGQIMDMHVNAIVNPGKDQGNLGVMATSDMILVKYPVWEAPWRGLVHTFNVTRDFLDTIGKMIVGAIPTQLSGPVGIVQITGAVAQQTTNLGWWPILSLTAVLSLNLAIVNILPFPALDGGRILLILIELVRGGKRLKPLYENIINGIGYGLLLLLMIVITVSDVLHWGQ